MKHFGTQLDILFREKKIVQKKFAEKIGVTEVTVSKWKSLRSIDAETLERIAQILNVPVEYFFDDVKYQKVVSANHGSAASINGNAVVRNVNRDKDNDCDKNKEIEHLKQLLEEKERTIKILMSQLNTKL